MSDDNLTRRSALKQLSPILAGGAAVMAGTRPAVGQETSQEVQEVQIGEYKKIDTFDFQDTARNDLYAGINTTVITDVIPAQHRLTSGARAAVSEASASSVLGKRIRFTGESPQRMTFTFRGSYDGFLSIDTLNPIVFVANSRVLLEAQLNRSDGTVFRESILDEEITLFTSADSFLHEDFKASFIASKTLRVHPGDEFRPSLRLFVEAAGGATSAFAPELGERDDLGVIYDFVEIAPAEG